VELRTTHRHGVELTLPDAARKDVRMRFSDAGVQLWGLGTTCEFQSADAATVARNIEECKRWCELAKAVGARGVKVRPNGLPTGANLQATLEQIGKSLAQCANAARDNGVEIWLEVHGPVTMNPPNIRTILDICAIPQTVGACWNSNPSDVVNGSVKQNFYLLAKDIKSCHINNLWDQAYPYRELFSLFRKAGYRGFTLCEVGTAIPQEAGVAFLQCYRGLWQELNRQ
jgi:sugar phosphate isomerase/epimerase